jgi:hypothetical protein
MTPPDLRYELTFEDRSSQRGSLSHLLNGLKALSTRGGSAIEGAYALAARAILQRKERLEDQNAERKFRQRSTAEQAPPVRRARSIQSVPTLK